MLQIEFRHSGRKASHFFRLLSDCTVNVSVGPVNRVKRGRSRSRCQLRCLCKVSKHTLSPVSLASFHSISFSTSEDDLPASGFCHV